jgi:hypothetical protein
MSVMPVTGDAVTHPNLGDGQVIDVEGRGPNRVVTICAGTNEMQIRWLDAIENGWRKQRTAA